MTDVVIFVEDPSAPNFVTELPDELKARGYSSQVFARATGASKGQAEEGQAKEGARELFEG